MKYPIGLVAVLAMGCAGSPGGGSTAPAQWELGPAPTVTIGAREGEPGHELSQVSGARMRNGQLLVANSGSSELRRFDSTGKYLGAAGRKGAGPGEFNGVFYLFPGPGDSLYTLDTGNLRWSLHDGRGGFVRVLGGGEAALARPSWLFHRTLVESDGPAAPPQWAIRLLDSLPESPAHAPLRRARFDDLGFLWVSDSAADNRWDVYGGAAPPLGRVTLPPGFTVMQAGKDFVLGVERDSVDRELVRSYPLARPAGLPSPAAAPTGALPAVPKDAEIRILPDFSRALMAQELFYSNHAAYTGNADSLGAKLASGAELVLLWGDKRRWAGVLYDRATRTTCGVSVGFPAPPGWSDGTPFCGR